MDVKAILNSVLSQSGFLEKTAFFASTDPDDKQMAAIANRVGYEILNYFDWPELRVTGAITTVAGTTLYDLPTDFQSLVPNSAWEDDGSRPVEWPTPNNEWFMYKFSTWSTGGTARIKMYGDQIEVLNDTDGDDFSYEYITNAYAETSGSDRITAFSADSDTFRLDDQLLVLGIQAHWQQAKQMPAYTEHFGNYQRKMTEAIGRANTGRTIGGVQNLDHGYRAPYTQLYLP